MAAKVMGRSAEAFLFARPILLEWRFVRKQLLQLFSDGIVRKHSIVADIKLQSTVVGCSVKHGKPGGWVQQKDGLRQEKRKRTIINRFPIRSINGDNIQLAILCNFCSQWHWLVVYRGSKGRMEDVWVDLI